MTKKSNQRDRRTKIISQNTSLPILILICVICVICGSGCAHKVESRQPPVAVRISLPDADAAEPAIATSSNGAVYVAWVEHLDDGANIMVRQFDSNGTPTGPALRVNPKAGEATAWRGDPPSLAIAPDGTMYVAWNLRQPEQRHATDLCISVSRDNGRSFEAPVKINADKQSGPQGMHSLAIGPQGTIYVAWLEESVPGAVATGSTTLRSVPGAVATGSNTPSQSKHKHMEENRELFVASSIDSGKTFSSKRAVASDVCPCCKTSLAIAPDGRVFVSWRQVLPGNLRHIAVATLTDHGQTVSPPVIVSDDRWILAGCPVSGSSLSVSNDGTLQVLWYADGQAGPKGVYRSESRDGGRSFSPRQLIAEGMTQGTPILLSQPGGTKAIWQRDQGTEAKVVTASIDSKGVVTISEENNSQLPAASMIGDQLVMVSIRQAANDRRSVWLVSR